MTKKQKIIFKWTAYFILLIILNISLISGILLFIGQDERLNGLLTANYKVIQSNHLHNFV
jgi:hypothetical protein